MLLVLNVLLTCWLSWAQGQEMTCDPPHIANGGYGPKRNTYRLEDEVTYWCKDGFYPVTRGSTAKCTRTGWEPPPRCSFKQCDIPKIKHGSLYRETVYRLYFPVTVGRWFYYSCDAGFVTDSQQFWDRITCTRDGWSPAVPCRRQCIFNYLENGYSPSRQTKHIQGDSIKVDCYPGFTLQSKQSSLTCTESGWDPPPRCIAVNCDVPVLENATVEITGTQFKFNDKLEYKCLDGFENRDGNTTGYMVCGEDGWSHLPTCYNSTEKCGPPPPISNGDVTSFLLTVYPPGSRVEYQCQAYYELGGSKYVTCSHAKWSEPPSCIVRLRALIEASVVPRPDKLSIPSV